MSDRRLELALGVGQSLPIHTCWCVKDGYVRATGCSYQADAFTIGIWGPGDIVVPEMLSKEQIELRALSGASVSEWIPEPEELRHFSSTHLEQMGVLLALTRIRPAEARLFNLLIWLSDRFGTPTERGGSVPLEAMNLTHRQLAEMASVSRVTVTKALGHFRKQGWLQRAGELEVLTPGGIALHRGLS